MSVADRLNKLSTDITNAYTSIESKGGTIPSNKNTNNLSTAIDSIEVIETATAEGESLSLTNTKAMPYSDYVIEGKSTQSGEPSPSNPSEIHSVADDVNLLNRITCEEDKAFVWTTGATFIETNSLVSDYINVKVNQKLIFTYNAQILFYDSSKTYLGCLQEGGTTIAKSTGISTNSLTVPNINDIYYMRLGFRPVVNNNQNMTSVNIKIQKGTVATPYSPYNQGTVTIKQRGKNLWNEELENAEYDANGNKEIATIWLVNKNKIEVNPNTTYTVSQQQTPSQYRIICFNNNTFLEWISSVQDITTGYKNFTFTTPVNCNKVYIQFRSIIEKIAQGNYNMIPSDITNIQLEQGSQATPYEPYQANDYTIQTEPLRSLPNGVKDTIEADGIHRRVGRVVLDGSENENWALSGTSTTGYYRFSSAIINNIVEKPSSNSQVVDILSNNYMKKSADNTHSLQTGICIATNGTIIIYDDNLKQYTVENFKTWLSTHNTEVLYPLATEIIEPLTQNQATTMLDIIKTGSYEGTTNIYTDEDVKPIIGVGYYKKS